MEAFPGHWRGAPKSEPRHLQGHPGAGCARLGAPDRRDQIAVNLPPDNAKAMSGAQDVQVKSIISQRSIYGVLTIRSSRSTTCGCARRSTTRSTARSWSMACCLAMPRRARADGADVCRLQRHTQAIPPRPAQGEAAPWPRPAIRTASRCRSTRRLAGTSKTRKSPSPGRQLAQAASRWT